MARRSLGQKAKKEGHFRNKTRRISRKYNQSKGKFILQLSLHSGVRELDLGPDKIGDKRL